MTHQSSNDCCICLEEINPDGDHDSITCDTCKNQFHYECLLKSKQTTCPLCRQSIKIKSSVYTNYTFNNMDDHNRYVFKIDNYINKWRNPSCIKDNHHFLLETLGDWGMHRGELRFDYKFMYIKCSHCDCFDII